MPRRFFFTLRFLLAILLSFLLTQNARAQASADAAREMGFTALNQQLGKAAPTGRGITIAHVEGGEHFQPDLRGSAFASVRAVNMSTVNSGKSDHATATASVIYGTTGLAPGVTSVHLYPATQWMNQGFLHIAQDRGPGEPALVLDHARVMNHSWIVEAQQVVSSRVDLREVLARIDDAVDRQRIIMVVGVNNGEKSPVPALLANAYNVIAVGNVNGNSSSGYTRDLVPGRCKPEIVAPMALTSFSTPAVTAAVARLLETADDMREQSRAASRPEVIKAVLLVSAEKTSNWQPEAGKPLDSRFGAGALRVDRAYAVLTAGFFAPGTISKLMGWNLSEMNIAARSKYDFEIREPVKSFSVIATWHRRLHSHPQHDLITNTTRWAVDPSLADFDLALQCIESDGSTKTIATSNSHIDNVEHVFMRDLPPGRYRIELSREDSLTEPWDCALAWCIEPAGPVVSR